MTNLRLMNPRSSVILLKQNYQRLSAFLATGAKVDFGINFENDGLRVKADLIRVEDKH